MKSPHFPSAGRAHSRNPGISAMTAAALAASLTLLTPAAAQAVAFSSDVAISAGVSFDTGYAISNFFGDASQGGSLSLVQGGVSNMSTYLGAAVTGNNPISGSLSDLGDGVGFTSSATSSYTGVDSGFGVNIVMDLSITNHSASDIYKVSFNVLFQNQVNSSGPNGYADSTFEAQNPVDVGNLFASRVVSDTLFGNTKGGVDLGTFGGVVSDSGPTSFFLTLAPGQTVTFAPGAIHATVLGLTLLDPTDPAASSSSSTTFGGFIAVAAVENLTSPVPEPSTLAMFGIGLLGLACRRRAHA